MKCYEYQAKKIFSAYGIPVPRGRVASNPSEAKNIAEELGGDVMIKAQVLVGGRGKAGGIRFASSPDSACEITRDLLESTLKGCAVEKVLVEERLPLRREFYCSITWDRNEKKPLLMVSPHGGVDIEDVPDHMIFSKYIDVPWGLMPFMARPLITRAGLQGSIGNMATNIFNSMYRLFYECDATLVEINPLVETDDGLVAADAKLTIDDDALYRQPSIPLAEELTPLESKMKSLGLAYVELDGDIAIMANGAGMAMATVDAISSLGGYAANFLDVGGGTSADIMAKGISYILENRPKALLINIFGGITRCDEVAKAIVQVDRQTRISIPVVVRLSGTNEDEGIRILQEAGFEATTSMEIAARKAVSLSKE